MKYKKFTGIVLKKQNYKEADQILTFWTKDTGKVRVLAKSIRLPKSKLAHTVCDLSLVEFEVVGSNLPVLISGKTIRQFKNIHEDLQKTAIGFYAAELMLKMTADEHPNDLAFDLLSEFFHKLDHREYYPVDYNLLDNFSLSLLESLGFKFPNPPAGGKQPDHSTINKFIEYILERNLKSEGLLMSLTN